MSDNEIDQIINQFQNIPTERQRQRRPRRMAQPAIRDYLDTIPPFNGDPILISNFILACENIIDSLGRTDDNNFNSFLVAHIRSKLVGRAAQLISVRNLKTWTELKEAILFTFGDQRDEDALMRDLIMLKQENNESSLRFGEKCQDTLSLLLSKVNCTEVMEALRSEKIKMYKSLAVKTFIKGVKEPYSLIVRCRNPQTLEEAINIVAEENNLNYIRKSAQNPNYNIPPINRNPQMNQQMPRRLPFPTYNARPAITPNRPIFNQVNRPYQWPNRPNYWQSQSQQQQQQRPTTSLQPFRPQINTQTNSSIQRRQQNYPQPMDTSSGNTNLQSRNHFQRSNQRPNFVFQELHHADVNQDYYDNTEYPVDQYEPGTSYTQEYYETYEPPENFEEYMENTMSEQTEPTPTVTEPENQDFQQDQARKKTR